MTYSESPDEQIEWFHWLAALPEEELLALSLTPECENFLNFIRAQLPEISLPHLPDPHAFADAVKALRANECEWNRALQQALIEADDLVEQRDPQKANGVLLNFASGCPWVLLRPDMFHRPSP